MSHAGASDEIVANPGFRSEGTLSLKHRLLVGDTAAPDPAPTGRNVCTTEGVMCFRPGSFRVPPFLTTWDKLSILSPPSTRSIGLVPKAISDLSFKRLQYFV